MSLNRDIHPCFNAKASHRYGRVHLPVAPRCNMQCNYCNRKYDCVNESRPGVSSSVLEPHQALYYMKKIVSKQPNITVAGIAGPGDPFANPMETMETLRLIRNEWPEMLLCLATNGLNLLPYVDELAELQTSHVTVTINAVDPQIGAQIYSWIRDKRVLRGVEAAELLLERQLAAVEALVSKGVTVKINSVLVPGVNDHHIPEVAKLTSKMGAAIFNCLPLYRNKETVFEYIEPPTPAMVREVKQEAGKYISQMNHCRQCRADAVGLLSADMTEESVKWLKEASRKEEEPLGAPLEVNDLVAVATMEGVLVNRHLGETPSFEIYQYNGGAFTHVEQRVSPHAGTGDARWNELADRLHDCTALFVSGVGKRPKAVLEERGLAVYSVEGMIQEVFSSFVKGTGLNHLTHRELAVTGAGCSGSGSGCGA